MVVSALEASGGISSGPAALMTFSFFTALSISAFDGGSTLTFRVRCAGSFARAGDLLTTGYGSWGPFLERPGKLTGPVSYFEIEVSRKVVCVLTSNEVHFVFFS